jgi:hypothetical protein
MSYASDEEAGVVRKLVAVSKILNVDEAKVLLECVAAVLDRVAVGRLVTDDSLALIRQFPSMYLGESAERINSRLTEMGVDDVSRRELVPKLKAMLARGQENQAPVGSGSLQALFARIARSGSDKLRCKSCGYHFRAADMGAMRKRLIESVGLEFSQGIILERLSDPIKTPLFTALEIDHIIPRVGWGSSDASNLQVLCQLCNQGKLIFESGFECISLIAASSYSLNFGMDYLPNRTVFYASMSMNDSRCMLCETTAQESELTIVPRSHWFTPWTVDVVCYHCFDA